MTTLLTITPQDTLNSLAFNIVHREREVHSYQINIDNYTQMLANLPQGDIPSDIIQYVGNKPEAHTKMEDLPLAFTDEQIELISKYQFRVNLTLLLRTEKAEQSKAKAILTSMKEQLPADVRDQLILDASTAINAQATPA